jgi:glucose/arabinose dehydrogenase
VWSRLNLTGMLAMIRCCWFLLPLAFIVGHYVSAGHAERPPGGDRPFGIDKRIPWTASHVIGSPNPPLPFRAGKAFPKLKVPCPIAIAREPGSDRLLLIHQMTAWSGEGRILRVKDDANVEEAEDLLHLDGIAYGLAFHPEFDKNGYVYVGWNGPLSSSPKYTRVTRYTIDRKPPYKLDPKSEKLIIEWLSDGHNGGDVAFGNDGMLYITSGDGTADSDGWLSGQDLTRLLAKVLRIDVDHPDPGKPYSPPKDNPFVATPGARPETWAYGFRNPWRIHIDRPTGDIWVGQNGQDLWEPVYLVQRGANYGWSVVEGSHPFYPNRKQGPTPISKPIVEHHHTEMRSLTGGVVYHGKKYPELQGAYLYGDWSTGKIWGLKHDHGKPTWHQELASTTMQITGFGIDAYGELLICDHGGNAIYTLERTPKDANPPKFPTKLSETGLFLATKDNRPDPALIPYSVNAPLWSDGAEKERFIALPGTSQIEYKPSRGWEFSDGAVLMKTFSLDLAGKGRRRIETRLLTRQAGQWAGYSYIWDDEQTDAVLVEAPGRDRVYEVHDEVAANGRRQQTWHYPSRTECMVCHSRAANWVLGLTELQLNKEHDYAGVRDNQLRTLQHIGVVNGMSLIDLGDFAREQEARAKRAVEMLRALVPPPLRGLLRRGGKQLTALVHERLQRLETSLHENQRYVTQAPKSRDDLRRLANPSDPKADLETRVRSYLHANCAQCHVEAGGGNAQIDLEFTTMLDKMKLVGVKPNHDTFGIADAKLIDRGHPERSVLLQRLKRRGTGQMPPLATGVVDREAVEIVREWILQLR